MIKEIILVGYQNKAITQNAELCQLWSSLEMVTGRRQKRVWLYTEKSPNQMTWEFKCALVILWLLIFSDWWYVLKCANFLYRVMDNAYKLDMLWHLRTFMVNPMILSFGLETFLNTKMGWAVPLIFKLYLFLTISWSIGYVGSSVYVRSVRLAVASGWCWFFVREKYW